MSDRNSGKFAGSYEIIKRSCRRQALLNAGSSIMYEFQASKYEDKHDVCRVVHLHVPIESNVAHMLRWGEGLLECDWRFRQLMSSY